MSKKLIGTDLGNYTFSPSTKKITITGLPSNYSLGIQQILLIVNATDQLIIFNFADPSSGGSIAGNVLTLLYDTTTMSSTDSLMIYVDVELVDDGVASLLRRMNKLLESNAVVDANHRQRVAVETMPTVAVTMAGGMGAASAVTIAAGQGPLGAANTQFPGAQPGLLASQNVQFVQVGPVDQRWQIRDQARASYATGPRASLTFS